MKKYITDSAGQPTELTQSFVIDSTGKQHGMTNIEFVNSDVIFKVVRTQHSYNPDIFSYAIRDILSTKENYVLTIPAFLTTYYADWDNTIHNDLIFIHYVHLNTFTNINTITGIIINALNDPIPEGPSNLNTMQINLNRHWTIISQLEFVKIFGRTAIAYNGLMSSNFGYCYRLKEFYIERINNWTIEIPERLFHMCHELVSFYIYLAPEGNYINNQEGITINGNAFNDCRKLRQITLRSERYRSNMVSYGGLTHLIPSTVTLAGTKIFDYTMTLENIELGVVDGLSATMRVTSASTGVFYNQSTLDLKLIASRLVDIKTTLGTNISKLEAYPINAETTNTGSLPTHVHESIMCSDFYGPLSGTGIYGRSKLEEVIIFSNYMPSILANCFTNLPALKKLVLYVHIPPTFTAGCFGGTTVKENITIHVPVGSIPAYEAAFGWSDFAGQYVEYIPEVYS